MVPAEERAVVPMALASAGRELPNGMYHRMEDPLNRFKNGMKLQILNSIAIFEVPRSKPKKRPRTVTLRKETDNSCIIDWTEVNAEWDSARLQYAVCAGVEGMLENGNHFWKLHAEYSSSEVAEALQQHVLPSPLPQLKDAVDAVDAAAAASASPHLPESHSSDEEIVLTPNPQPQRRWGKRKGLEGPRR